MALELGNDGWEGVVGGWDIVVGTLDACTERIPPAKWHIPVWATNLQVRFRKIIVPVALPSPKLWLYKFHVFHLWLDRITDGGAYQDS